MRVFISGPMTGIKDYNYPAFMDAAARLRAKGMEPVNPAEIHDEAVVGSKNHSDYMREDIRALLDCGAICLLAGWQDSIGASCEAHVAQVLGLEVVDLP